MAAALVSSPLALAVPAQATDQEHGLKFAGFTSIQSGGPWSEGSVTVTNDADTEYDTQHLVLYFGEFELGLDQVAVEYADGDADSWHAAPLVAMDLSAVPTDGHDGVSTDLTGAAVKVAPHSARTFKLRVKLLQSNHVGLIGDFPISGYLATGLDPKDKQAVGSTVPFAGLSVPATGLDVAIDGLPKPVPADGRPHAFQVSVKTANGFDWHLSKASFFLWAGQQYGKMEGPAACDAELDVQNPADGSWHRVGLKAAGAYENDVDLVKWGSGPVDDRKLNARITLGKNFHSTADDSSIGFGYFPGAGNEDHFWTTQKFTSTPVAGAPDCVDPDAPPATPSAAASAAPVQVAAQVGATAAATPAVTATATPTRKPSASKAPSSRAATAEGADLADTGSSGTGAMAGLAAALIAAGSAAVLVSRRRGRRA